MKRGSLAAAAVATASASRFAMADPLGLPIGIQLYTVGADVNKDAPAAIKQIAAIGYKEVETAGFGSLKTATEFRKALDANGLKCPSAHLQFDLKDLNKAFDDAHALGCQYATTSVPRMILMAQTGSPYSMTPEQRAAFGKKMMSPLEGDEIKRMADAMNTVGAAAKTAGLGFASHNHTMEFAMYEGKPGFDYLMTHTDPALVKFEIDCGWITVAGYKPGEYVDRYPGRVKMLHIKDFLPFDKSANPGPGSVKGSEIGQGVVDYKAIFASMKGKGIQHIFVEQEGPYSRMPAMEAATVDYKYLHSLA
jgi:sugar phosphate isomerase/epimerase